MARLKIAVLYVGGSIGMIRNRRTGRIEQLDSIEHIHRFLPEAQRDVSLEFFTVANVGSSEVTPEHWVLIAEKIRALYDRFDGFVVIHGTNTMAYTAAALSFALQNLSKPIILTGSILPLDELGSDARMNLAYALQAAQLDLAEVCVVLGPRVLRGNRAKKTDQSIIKTFSTPRMSPLVRFDATVELSPRRVVRRKRSLIVKPAFDPNVLSITLHPGMPEHYFDLLLDFNPSGIVLRAYGQGMLPESLFPWLREATKRKIPIVIVSQLQKGSIDLHRFRKQMTLESMGVISGMDMTYECAVTKLMWVLAQTKDPRRVRELMEKSLAGELTHV
ncbi:MAG: asparaginase [Candidatus Peribacteraceae bacterium]